MKMEYVFDLLHLTSSSSSSSSYSLIIKFMTKRWPQLILYRLQTLLCFSSAMLIITFFYLLLKKHTSTNIHINNFIKKWRPFLGSLPHILLNLHRIHDWTMEVTSNLQANTVYIGQSLVFTSDPKNVEYILKTNFSNFPKGTDYVETFDFLGQGIFAVDSNEWRAQRKLANTVFATKEFRSLIANVSKKVIEEQLLPLLFHVSKQNSAAAAAAAAGVDLQNVFTRYAFDTMVSIVVGGNPKTLSIGFPYNEFAEATDNALIASFYRNIMPMPLWKCLRLLRLGTERKMAKARRAMDRYISHCISLRREEIKQQQETEASSSLLAMYMIRCSSEDDNTDHVQVEEGSSNNILLQQQQQQQQQLDKFLGDSALNFLLAGRDTVPSALSWFFLLVSKTPRVEAKILEELAAVSLKKSSSNDNNKKPMVPWVVFDFEDTREMVYLHAALYESMRIYPPIPFTRKSVLKEDVLPDGNIVRPGMNILYSIYGMGRMESIWGKDSMEFRPERWLDDNGKLNYEVKKKYYYVFNMGPRYCVGKDAALAQIKMAASAVLYNFKVKVIQGQDFSVKPAIILQMNNGFMVQIEERAH